MMHVQDYLALTPMVSLYLERFQVDLLHCQATIFCEKLRGKQNDDEEKKKELL